MKKLFLLVLVFAIALMAFTPALAAPPCNDTNEDGSPSGYEYGQYHIKEAAHAGILGHIHKPGAAHKGFSACNPSEL
jgi:hypothetical protein